MADGNSILQATVNGSNYVHGISRMRIRHDRGNLVATTLCGQKAARIIVKSFDPKAAWACGTCQSAIRALTH